MSDILTIIADNLDEEGEKLFSLEKRFPVYLEDICRELLDKNAASVGDEELALSYSHLKEDLSALLSQKTLLFDGAPLLSAELAKAILRRVEVESYLPAYENTPSRVAYFRNAYADLAYRRFSAGLKDPTVSYHDSFQAVCEEVYNDRCDFAILPVESSRDGKLTSMERLLEKYELAPMLYCSVPTQDESVIRFGLFAPTPTVYKGADSVSFFLYDDKEKTLANLLSAAFHLGCRLKECKVLSEGESHGGYRHAWRLTLSAPDEKTLLTLRILLLCEYPHHLLVGIFKEINSP